ncbi:MAG: nucleoside monophosphate kinase [Myxococcaceae bacterium]
MTSPLVRLYFSASLRGGADFNALSTRITILERFGEVTTRHMAHPHTADAVGADDAAIYAADQRLLASSDLYLADLSQPSTGAGFMTARALELGKPVLALFHETQKPSAMIAGHPRITTARFTDDSSFTRAVTNFLAAQPDAPWRLRAPKVVLAGPPGSGKGTLGKTLSTTWGLPHLSTGEILRELVAQQPDHPLSRRVDGYMKAGQLVPADLMRDIVLERLGRADCARFGFLLDGYPPSRADLDNLRGVTPDVVFLLECDDATAIARQVSRAARSTDTPEKARTRLEVYRAQALTPDWFPKSVTVRLDASRPPAEVEAAAHESLTGLLGDPRRSRSFNAVAPFKSTDVRSTRVHLHVDAADSFRVRDLAREILTRHPAAQGQLKLYPIDALQLGPQTTALPIYRHLPNFHPIAPGADAECFITGRLGDGDDALMQVVRDVTREHGGMTELEEYTGEWTLRADGEVVTDARYEPMRGRFDALLAASRDGLCPDVPPLELHLGFDVPRVNGALPLPLPELMARCTDAGLQNGGWFVFRKDGLAAYRSNEFSALDLKAGEEKVRAQAHALRTVLAAARLTCDIAFSVELVHGMWTWPAR